MLIMLILSSIIVCNILSLLRICNCATSSFYSVGQSTFTVPPTVTSVTATVIGGISGTVGATAIQIVSTFDVTPGDILYIYVGGNGGTDGTGGYNGGGAGFAGGWGGGGASDIRTILGNLSSRIMVAGGAGGSGYYTNVNYYLGGQAGCAGASGVQGAANPNVATSYGGSQTEGGLGFYNSASYTGSVGTSGVGGAAAINSYAYGGGGGGGYFGGGGGSGTAGGGGSSYSKYPSQCFSGGSSSVVFTYAETYTVTYDYTGAQEIFFIPNDVSTILVNATGAQGSGSDMGTGGRSWWFHFYVGYYNFPATNVI